MKSNCFYIIISLLAPALLFGCKNDSNTTIDPVVATVNGEILRTSQVIEQIPDGISNEDSSYYAKQIVTNWLQQRLLVNEAETKLKGDEKEIQQELERYREELLIHRYKSSRLDEIVNKVVRFEEIEKYYNDNIDKFSLTSPIVRINYIIFPKEIELSNYHKKLAISNDPDDIGELEDYVYRFAKKYDNFNESFIYFSKIQGNLDFEIDDVTKFLKNNKWIEFERGNNLHFIAIKQYMLEGETAPLDFVTEQIKSQLINQYKLDFLKEIKDSLYQDALKYNKFSILK